MLWGRVVGRARTGPAHMGGASRGPPARSVGLCAQARVGSGRGLPVVSVLSPCCRALRSAPWWVRAAGGREKRCRAGAEALPPGPRPWLGRPPEGRVRGRGRAGYGVSILLTAEAARARPRGLSNWLPADPRIPERWDELRRCPAWSLRGTRLSDPDTDPCEWGESRLEAVVVWMPGFPCCLVAKSYPTLGPHELPHARRFP